MRVLGRIRRGPGQTISLILFMAALVGFIVIGLQPEPVEAQVGVGRVVHVGGEHQGRLLVRQQRQHLGHARAGAARRGWLEPLGESRGVVAQRARLLGNVLERR